MKMRGVKLLSVALALLCLFCLTACDSLQSLVMSGESSPKDAIIAHIAPVTDDITSITDDDLDSAKALIDKRLNDVNIFDAVLTPDYEKKRIYLEIPWAAVGETEYDAQTLVDETIQMTKLTFYEVEPYVDVPDLEVDGAKKNEKKEEATTDEEIEVYTELGGHGTYKRIGDEIMTGQEVKHAEATSVEGNTVVLFDLSPEGRKKFAEATALLASKGGMIGVFVDDTLISAATVEETIDSERIQICSEEFNSNPEDAKILADRINAGGMPYEMEVIEINVKVDGVIKKVSSLLDE